MIIMVMILLMILLLMPWLYTVTMISLVVRVVVVINVMMKIMKEFPLVRRLHMVRWHINEGWKNYWTKRGRGTGVIIMTLWTYQV